MDNFGLSLTCQEVFNTLMQSPDDCRTKNDLTWYPRKSSGNHRRNWRLVSECLADLEMKGLVHSDKKCVKKAKCFKVERQNDSLEEVGPTTVDEVTVESNVDLTKWHIPRIENPSDPYTEFVSRSISKPVYLRTPNAPV